jgi:hypothetical protein
MTHWSKLIVAVGFVVGCTSTPPPDPTETGIKTGTKIDEITVCGDGVCAYSSGAENCGNCPADCACAAGYLCQNHFWSGYACDGHIVGDGICARTLNSFSEDCFNSPSDCACGAGTGCATFIQDVGGVPLHGCVSCGIHQFGCFDENSQPCDPCTSSCTCPY